MCTFEGELGDKMCQKLSERGLWEVYALGVKDKHDASIITVHVVQLYIIWDSPRTQRHLVGVHRQLVTAQSSTLVSFNTEPQQMSEWGNDEGYVN